MTSWRGCLAVGCALVALAAPQAVGDGETKPSKGKGYDDARRCYDAAKGGSLEAHAKAIEDLARAAAASGNLKQRKDARKVLKKSLKCKEQALVAAALRGYGQLALPKSSRDLKKFVDKKASKKIPKALRTEAIKAWTRIQDPGSHEALLDYIKLPMDDKTLRELAVLCAVELRNYKGGTRKQRFTLLEDYMKVFDMVYSSGIGSFMASAVAAAWWDKVKDPMLETFNELVSDLADEPFESYPDARDWWRQMRKVMK